MDKDTTIKTTDVTQEENLILGETALQNIQVDISNTGVKKLHYRIPDSIDAEAIKIMVKDKNANWSDRAFIVEGSYFVFEVSPFFFRISKQTPIKAFSQNEFIAKPISELSRNYYPAFCVKSVPIFSYKQFSHLFHGS